MSLSSTIPNGVLPEVTNSPSAWYFLAAFFAVVLAAVAIAVGMTTPGLVGKTGPTGSQGSPGQTGPPILGILGVESGGTNSNATLQGNKLIVSDVFGKKMVEGTSSADPSFSTLTLTSSQDSTSPGSGSFVAAGGLGILKNASVGKNVKVYGTQDATSSDSGSIVTYGGLGVAKSVVVGTSTTTYGITMNNDTVSYVPSVLNYYEEYAQIMLFEDQGVPVVAQSNPFTLRLVRTGKSIVGFLPNVLFDDPAPTPGPSIVSTQPIPVRFRPTLRFQIPIITSNGTGRYIGRFNVSTSGILTIRLSFDPNVLFSFSATNNEVEGVSCSWTTF
jgi:hypothetical protein